MPLHRLLASGQSLSEPTELLRVASATAGVRIELDITPPSGRSQSPLRALWPAAHVELGNFAVAFLGRPYELRPRRRSSAPHPESNRLGGGARVRNTPLRSSSY